MTSSLGAFLSMKNLGKVSALSALIRILALFTNSLNSADT